VIRAALLEFFISRLSFGYSNVPGPKKPYVVDGKRSKDIVFIMPVGKSLTASLSIISHWDTVKCAFSLDKSLKISSRELMDMFEGNLDEVLGKQWRDHYPWKDKKLD